jgi:hypothetical protein
MLLLLSLLSAHCRSPTDSHPTSTDVLDSAGPSGEPSGAPEPSPGTPKGRTAGIVLAAVVVAVMIVAIIFLARKKRRPRDNANSVLDQSLTAEPPISEQF